MSCGTSTPSPGNTIFHEHGAELRPSLPLEKMSRGTDGLAPGDRVLDVSAGPATSPSWRTGPWDRKAGSSFTYQTGPSLKEAGPRWRLPQSRDGSITSRGTPSASLSPSGHFDAAMVGFGIAMVTRMEKGFSEMHRVLKPGGELMCLEFSLPVWRGRSRLCNFYSFQIMSHWREKSWPAPSKLSLPTRIRPKFPPPEELSTMLGQMGFSQVSSTG